MTTLVELIIIELFVVAQQIILEILDLITIILRVLNIKKNE